MNTAAKGRRNEHRSRALLEAAGYAVTRAAGSMGIWEAALNPCYNAASGEAALSELDRCSREGHLRSFLLENVDPERARFLCARCDRRFEVLRCAACGDPIAEREA